MTPMLYTVSTAFKSNVLVFEVPPQFIPKNPSWDNYITAWQSNNFSHYFMNSLQTAVATTLGTVFVAAMERTRLHACASP